MKIRPDYDFPMKVNLQIWEETDKTALLYAGIIFIALNGMPCITFVPRTRKTPANWPPTLPDNTDDIKTAEEARLVTIALANYSVTPDEERAGTEEIILLPAFEVPIIGRYVEPSPSVVFFTTLDEYEVLTDQALELWPRGGGRLGVPVSEIEGTKLARFLLTRVIASPHFGRLDLKMLSR